jgi:hypothetical protein
VPDLPGGLGDDAAALRSANARLRQVVDARNIEIAVLRAQHEAQARALEALRAATPPGSATRQRPGSG